jgi:hypothetical protein
VGKDMPLIEFLSKPPVIVCNGEGLFSSDPGRKPFGLIKNHFKFVFEHCSADIDIDQYIDTE